MKPWVWLKWCWMASTVRIGRPCGGWAGRRGWRVARSGRRIVDPAPVEHGDPVRAGDQQEVAVPDRAAGVALDGRGLSAHDGLDQLDVPVAAAGPAGEQRDAWVVAAVVVGDHRDRLEAVVLAGRRGVERSGDALRTPGARWSAFAQQLSWAFGLHGSSVGLVGTASTTLLRPGRARSRASIGAVSLRVYTSRWAPAGCPGGSSNIRSPKRAPTRPCHSRSAGSTRTRCAHGCPVPRATRWSSFDVRGDDCAIILHVRIDDEDSGPYFNTAIDRSARGRKPRLPVERKLPVFEDRDCTAWVRMT